ESLILRPICCDLSQWPVGELLRFIVSIDRSCEDVHVSIGVGRIQDLISSCVPGGEHFIVGVSREAALDSAVDVIHPNVVVCLRNFHCELVTVWRERKGVLPLL